MRILGTIATETTPAPVEATESKGKVAQLRKKIAELNTERSGLDTQLRKLRREIADAESQVQQIERDVLLGAANSSHLNNARFSIDEKRDAAAEIEGKLKQNWGLLERANQLVHEAQCGALKEIGPAIEKRYIDAVRRLVDAVADAMDAQAEASAIWQEAHGMFPSAGGVNPPAAFWGRHAFPAVTDVGTKSQARSWLMHIDSKFPSAMTDKGRRMMCGGSTNRGPRVRGIALN